MRWLVWWCVAGVAACGGSSSVSGRRGGESGAGGDGTSGGGGEASGGDVSGGSGVGASGGGQVAGAGASSAAGQSNAGQGAAGQGTAGQGTAGQGTAGHGTAGHGTAGQGGMPGNMCSPYVACGCGCCASEPLDARCSYPELGDDLAAVARDDQMTGRDPACGMIGCGDGIRHHCCVKPTDNDAATYDVSTYSGALDRLTVTRTGEAAQRCTSLVLAHPAAATDRFRISAPDGWAVESGADYACADVDSAAAASRRYPIGGFGDARWASAEGCFLDLDVTLFFLAANGGVDAVWFQASGLDATGLPGCD